MAPWKYIYISSTNTRFWQFTMILKTIQQLK
jgi:hypothetical protein